MLGFPVLRSIALTLSVALVSGCGGASLPPAAPQIGLQSHTQTQPGHARRGSSPATGIINHVVFIVQENRSFNFMFMGFKGALTQDYGLTTNGQSIPLHPQTIATNWDIDHSANGFFAAYDNGKIDGWNNEYACCNQPANFAYAHAIKSEVRPYWDMAKQYVLADHMFQSNIDGSFISHQYAIAAYANHEVNFPSADWGCEGGYDQIQTLNQDRSYGPTVPVCEDYSTLGDELDTAGIPWKSYTASYNADGGIWNAYGVINHIYNGPDWTQDVLTPAARFTGDVQSGNLAAVTWITPTYEDSDHSGENSSGGPAWVSSLVNAVGESQFWDSTAIFIIWDDWGGFYDPVSPVYEDYDGTGFRIPLIVISPYAKSGYVTHVQYETASVLKFAEDDFGVPALAAADARANDPATDVFDFTQRPIRFKPFDAKTQAVRGPRTARRRRLTPSARYARKSSSVARARRSQKLLTSAQTGANPACASALVDASAANSPTTVARSCASSAVRA
jgi:phospholipase C